MLPFRRETVGQEWCCPTTGTNALLDPVIKEAWDLVIKEVLGEAIMDYLSLDPLDIRHMTVL
jgi:hypothetical protein